MQCWIGSSVELSGGGLVGGLVREGIVTMVEKVIAGARVGVKTGAERPPGSAASGYLE